MAALTLFDRLLEAGATPPERVLGTLSLPFEQRQRTRQRVRLGSGLEIGLDLPRGTVLRGGDLLGSAAGAVVAVAAALERVSVVTVDSPQALARAAYHLGNRHVPVEVRADGLRYLEDHVLDAMIRGLGLRVVHEAAPFEPETGAYAHGHAHTHAHDR